MTESVAKLVRAIETRPDLLAELLEAEDLDAFHAATIRVARTLGLVVEREELDRALADARRAHIERWLR